MKKTLITALITLGMAASASAALTLEDATLSYSQYDSAQDGLTFSGDFSTLSGTRAEFTMTFVLDWNQLQTLTTTDTALAVMTDGNSLNTGVGICLDDGELVAKTWYTGARSSSTNSLENYVSENGLLVLTVRHNANGTRLIPGTQSATYWTDGSLKWQNAQFDGLTINSTLAGAIESFYVFNSSVTDDEVVSLTTAAYAAALANAVPEPTTATLSLLALAGLCARRRRK